MCGIAGIAGQPDRASVSLMCEVLQHRGPDDEGIYSDIQVCLGMRRLAVIDLPGGHQPIQNEDGRLRIVFNGEIYNYLELRSDLLGKGHEFTTFSDTEVIVHLYEEYGEACLNRLEGMFAFAIWDRKEETLFLARDPIGVKPLFYVWKGERLLFASEIQALLAVDDSLNELDPEALHSFLSYLYVSAPKTMFRSIRRLPPGHFLKYRNRTVRVRRYWGLDSSSHWEPSGVKIQGDDYVRHGLSLLRDAVRKRMISDVPLGAFLSGGMDSASIVALMSEYSARPVKTFTVGYGDEDASYNELSSARVVAERFGTDHHEFILQPDVVEVLPEIVRMMGEPMADSSAIPTYLISRETKKHVTVALSGIGGDEVFLGYPRYLGARLSGIYESVPFWMRRWIFSPVGESLPESTRSRNLGGWIKRFVHGGRLDPVDRYLSWISFYTPEMKGSLYSGEFRDLLRESGSSDIHREYLSGMRRLEYVRRVSCLDLMTYLPDDLLFMADSMSMAHSLELRVPFCDRRLVEFLVGIPTRIRMRRFRLKRMLREMMKWVLPPEILDKKKQGFMVPIGGWFRRDLNGYLRDMLLSGRAASRGFFKPPVVERMVKDHLSGAGVYTHHLWALLTFEVWCRTFLDGEGLPWGRAVLSGVG